MLYVSSICMDVLWFVCSVCFVCVCMQAHRVRQTATKRFIFFFYSARRRTQESGRARGEWIEKLQLTWRQCGQCAPLAMTILIRLKTGVGQSSTVRFLYHITAPHTRSRRIFVIVHNFSLYITFHSIGAREYTLQNTKSYTRIEHVTINIRFNINHNMIDEIHVGWFAPSCKSIFIWSLIVIQFWFGYSHYRMNGFVTIKIYVRFRFVVERFDSLFVSNNT